MIRGGSTSKRLSALLACALVALAAAVPATASAQSAVDEYTLDVPQAGGSDPSDPTSSASGGAGGAAGTTASGGGGAAAAGGNGLAAAEARERRQERREERREDDNINFGDLHDGKTQAADSLNTSSRSFPEVIADTATDGAML
ncbi:MAG: hypothetical protein ACRDMA_11095, partial [Solirubrobacterales bacterium]